MEIKRKYISHTNNLSILYRDTARAGGAGRHTCARATRARLPMGVSTGTLTAAVRGPRHIGHSFAVVWKIFLVQALQYPPCPQGTSTQSGGFSTHITHIASPLDSVVVVILSPALQDQLKVAQSYKRHGILL